MVKHISNSIVVQLEHYISDKPWTTIKELARLVIQYHKERKKLLDKHYIGKLLTTLYVNSGRGEDRFTTSASIAGVY